MLSTRTEFKEYCLRALGSPVIQVNVADDQVEDRIDEAVQYWQEFHTDGYVGTFLKHEITQTDIDNGWIPIDDDVLYVRGVVPFKDKAKASTFFNIEYQMHLNDIFDLSYHGGMSHFVQTKQYLGLMDDTFRGRERIRYSRREQKLYLDINWTTVTVGQYLIIDAFRFLDPANASNAWNDRWLKRYATALIQRQWGLHLIKFGGVALLGGVTMQGDAILADAYKQIELLEEEIRGRYSEPIDFMIG